MVYNGILMETIGISVMVSIGLLLVFFSRGEAQHGIIGSPACLRMKMICMKDVFESLWYVQELSERMEAVLLEKAESQQSLSLLRRQHEELQKQAQVTLHPPRVSLLCFSVV